MEQGGQQGVREVRERGARGSRRAASLPVLLVVIPSALVVLAALLLDGLGGRSKALGLGLLVALALPAALLARASRGSDSG